MEYINVTRSSMPDINEYVEEIRSIWNTHWLTNMGEKHELFRTKLKDFLKVNNVELLTNGHMALEMSLQALNLKGEVITTPFTFASTTHAIVRNGLTPVFCDIKGDDYTIDVNRIESLITDKTCAIMPVHVYGNICDVDSIESIAKKYDLKVIYDAAHAFGEEYDGRNVANFGDVSCFSFHATKVFNSIEGGAVCYTDEEFGKEIYRLKNFGIKSEDVVDGVGANAKMNEFCAAMGLCNLRHLEEEIEKRKNVAERYRERLSNVDGLILNSNNERTKSNYAYFPIIINEKKFGKTRNEVKGEFSKHGIYVRKYFYPLTSSFDCFHGKYDCFNTPIALNVSKRVLTLPLYSDLQLDEVDKICDVLINMKSNN